MHRVSGNVGRGAWRVQNTCPHLDKSQNGLHVNSHVYYKFYQKWHKVYNVEYCDQDVILLTIIHTRQSF